MIRLEKLSIGFAGKPTDIVLVDAIDVEVVEGEICSIIGRNGTGKTTTIRTISNLHPSLSGSILIEGEDLKGYTLKSLAKKIAIVNTQRFNLGYLSVLDLVEMGRQPHTGYMGMLGEHDREIIEKVIADISIQDLLDRPISQLSDGEYQKVMLGRALAQSTPILILDEPTAHLDLINRLQIFKLLRRLSSELNVTILLSTHEIESALTFSDKLVLLDGKGGCRVGTPQELIESGAIADTFAADDIKFDPESVRFSI